MKGVNENMIFYLLSLLMMTSFVVLALHDIIKPSVFNKCKLCSLCQNSFQNIAVSNPGGVLTF